MDEYVVWKRVSFPNKGDGISCISRVVLGTRVWDDPIQDLDLGLGVCERGQLCQQKDCNGSEE